ncbi:MAG: hypothetical protein HWE07_07895 [Cytophagia bacterium]|nr:hypothetical protein [Cytophagia bacterium]
MKKILLSALVLGLVSFVSADLKAQSNGGNNNGNVFYVGCEVDSDPYFLKKADNQSQKQYLISYCREAGGTPRVYSFTSYRKAQEVFSRKYLLALEKQRREEEREDRKNGN